MIVSGEWENKNSNHVQIMNPSSRFRSLYAKKKKKFICPTRKKMDETERGGAPKSSSPAGRLTGTIHLFPLHMLLPRCPTFMIRR